MFFLFLENKQEEKKDTRRQSPICIDHLLLKMGLHNDTPLEKTHFSPTSSYHFFLVISGILCPHLLLFTGFFFLIWICALYMQTYALLCLENDVSLKMTNIFGSSYTQIPEHWVEGSDKTSHSKLSTSKSLILNVFPVVASVLIVTYGKENLL